MNSIISGIEKSLKYQKNRTVGFDFSGMLIRSPETRENENLQYIYALSQLNIRN